MSRSSNLRTSGRELPVSFVLFFAERMCCQIAPVSVWSVTDAEKRLRFVLLIRFLVKLLYRLY